MTKISSLNTAAALLLPKSKADTDSGQSPVATPTPSTTVTNAPGSATLQAAAVIGNAALSEGWQTGGADTPQMTAEYFDAIRAKAKAIIADVEKNGADAYAIPRHDADILKAVRAMGDYKRAYYSLSHFDITERSEADKKADEMVAGRIFLRDGSVDDRFLGLSDADLREIGEIERADKLETGARLMSERVTEVVEELRSRVASFTVQAAQIEKEFSDKYDVSGDIFVEDADGQFSWGEFEVREKGTGALVYSHDGSGTMIDHTDGARRSLDSNFGW